ncbi:MAG TPA: hypothetical protein VKX17_01050 [Planctomycetota bacterium]|nr:hypothetical protein [Planctomycetota bacterium]
MQTQMQPKSIVRRRRFQFSLRTLMATVLVYGGLWLVTLKWGGRVLALSYAEAYRDEDVRIADNDMAKLEVYPRRKYPWMVDRQALRGTVYVPAPFVLIWRWEYKERGRTDWLKIPEDSDFHFWLMGYHWTRAKYTSLFHYRRQPALTAYY